MHQNYLLEVFSLMDVEAIIRTMNVVTRGKTTSDSLLQLPRTHGFDLAYFLLTLASSVPSFKCQQWQHLVESDYKLIMLDGGFQLRNWYCLAIDASHYVEIGPKGRHNFLAQIVTFLKQSLHSPNLFKHYSSATTFTIVPLCLFSFCK